MASILDRYGIKEVTDVVFYELDPTTGKPTHPVLYLDTLKVSTIEQTAEEASANGGKGNASLIIWDYNKEISVTLEDALFSAKSMAVMFGNGNVDVYGTESAAELLMKTVQFVCETDGKGIETWEGPDGKMYPAHNPKFYDENGTMVAEADLKADKKYFCTFDIRVAGSLIEISASSFPGTYYVTGDTYARSEASGADEFFQFIIPKAKVQSENTITLEAEGDPSVFNMSLRVMRPADGKMMKLVKYNVLDEGSTVDKDISIVHNHVLEGTNTTEEDDIK